MKERVVDIQLRLAVEPGPLAGSPASAQGKEQFCAFPPLRHGTPSAWSLHNVAITGVSSLVNASVVWLQVSSTVCKEHLSRKEDHTDSPSGEQVSPPPPTRSPTIQLPQGRSPNEGRQTATGFGGVFETPLYSLL